MIYSINDLPAVLMLGNEGENLVTTVNIDCSDWLSLYPSAFITATIQLPGMADPVPLPSSLDGAILTLTVTRSVTQYPGGSTIVIRLVGQDDEEKRSKVVRGYVHVGHGTTGNPPDPVQDWLDQTTLQIDGRDFVSAGFVGQDLVFVKRNGDTVSITDAATTLRGKFEYEEGTTPPTDTSIFWIDTGADPEVGMQTLLAQTDRYTPRQNVLTPSAGSIEVGYAKSPIRESQEIHAFLEWLGW